MWGDGPRLVALSVYFRRSRKSNLVNDIPEFKYQPLVKVIKKQNKNKSLCGSNKTRLQIRLWATILTYGTRRHYSICIFINAFKWECLILGTPTSWEEWIPVPTLEVLGIKHDATARVTILWGFFLFSIKIHAVCILLHNTSVFTLISNFVLDCLPLCLARNRSSINICTMNG